MTQLSLLIPRMPGQPGLSCLACSPSSGPSCGEAIRTYAAGEELPHRRSHVVEEQLLGLLVSVVHGTASYQVEKGMTRDDQGYVSLLNRIRPEEFFVDAEVVGWSDPEVVWAHFRPV